MYLLPFKIAMDVRKRSGNNRFITILANVGFFGGKTTLMGIDGM